MKKLTLVRWLILVAAITSIYACGNAVGKATGQIDEPTPSKNSSRDINIDATVEAKLALIAVESTAEAKLSERPQILQRPHWPHSIQSHFRHYPP